MKDTILNSILIIAAFGSIMLVAFHGGDTAMQSMSAATTSGKTERTIVVAKGDGPELMLVAADSPETTGGSRTARNSQQQRQ